MAMKKLGLYLIEALADRGVSHVFGIPGVHNLELYRGLAGGPIRHITGRHEQGLGFMADGYARLSGRPGVCFTITGPGLTNITTAMGQAYGDSIPLLVISSRNRRGEAGSGRGFLHELPDQRALASQVAAASDSIEEPGQLPEALGRAFAMFSSARPRPVYIEIPLDVLAADATGLALPAPSPAAPVPPATALDAAADRLRSAKRPVVLAGGGGLRAAGELRRLAEHLGAPVVMTTNARGILPPGHPLAVPRSPSLEPVRALIAAADSVLAVGTELGPTDYDMYGVSEFPNPPGLMRIDIEAAQLTRSARPVIPLCGEAGATLRALLARDLGAARPGAGEATAAAACERALAALSPAMRRQVTLLDLIRDALPSAVLVGDSTQLVYAGNLGFAAASPGSWFNSATGYGTLGYALPAATGAGLAVPDRPVVCLVGDGGLQFSLGELAVPGEVDGWTAIVVWNNRGFGEIKTAMIAAGIAPEGVDVRPPEFAHLARAYGYGHRMIEDPAALERALKEFGRRRQVVLLEIRAEAFE
ncbi:MAG TPA: 5-guanidino-2-oxopentanoate decarboxylase [Steroidobacteraceae bacterium]|nr:5-guanidino-2-oxopentanoate decarboxylase [Steroidobacteraceae bacterium]